MRKIEHFEVVGIDPGLTGGIALVQVSPDSIRLADALSLPIDQDQSGPIGNKRVIHPTRLRMCFGQVAARGRKVIFAVVERQETRPKQDVSGSLTAAFNYGVVATVVQLSFPEDRVFWVPPKTWKQDMELGSDKEDSRTLATTLFGAEAGAKYWWTKNREGIAEAALIAYWRARRLRMLMAG